MKNALILLAGGQGKRLKSKKPKQFLKVGNTNLIEYFLSNLNNNIFDIIVIAIKAKDKKYISLINKKFKNFNIKFSKAGKTRQISSKNSLEFLKKYNPKKVLIHDSARPFVSNFLIKKIINNLKKNTGCVPFIVHNDLIKIDNKKINKDKIINIQTPQGFIFKDIYKAHKLSKSYDEKDDSTIFEKYHKVKMIKGERSNLKITTKEDLVFFNHYRIKEYKSGIGYDIHKIDYLSKKKLTLCGIKIDHPPLIGHSDADVGLHAICDSILGALSMKDIGYYFKNSNDKWKNANSKIFIDFCCKKLKDKGFKIVNLDINFICEKPNINKLRTKMKKKLSSILNISVKIISIKATTNEKIGFIGKGEGIAAESIVQIINV